MVGFGRHCHTKRCVNSETFEDRMMVAMKFRNAGDIRSYLYRSKAKIDWLYEQIQHRKEKKTVTWKIDLKLFSLESKKESEDEFNVQDRLDAIVAALEEREMVGPPGGQQGIY